MALTPREAGEFIVQRWRAEHWPSFIMVQLILLGAPVSKADVLAVIRAYVDHNSENRGSPPTHDDC
jgi:hypothetical protein